MEFGDSAPADEVMTIEMELKSGCTGNQVAARNLFITISRLLYCFNFEYAGVIQARCTELIADWEI